MRPILFEIGVVAVYSYGVFFLLGMVTWLGLMTYEARRRGRPWDEVGPVVLATFVGMMVGSRVTQVFIEPEAASQLLDFFNLFNPALGGRNLVGAILGGFLLALAFEKALGIARGFDDASAPGIALGIAVGRIGCLLGGCCHGVPTDLPWAIELHGVRGHPTQVYDGLFNLALFFILWRLRDRMPQRGALFKLYLVAYGAFRFWQEFLRVNPPLALGLTMPQWACLLLLGGMGLHALQRWWVGRAARVVTAEAERV